MKSINPTSWLHTLRSCLSKSSETRTSTPCPKGASAAAQCSSHLPPLDLPWRRTSDEIDSGPDALKLGEWLSEHYGLVPASRLTSSQDEKCASPSRHSSCGTPVFNKGSIIGPLVKTAIVTLGVWCVAFACACMWLVTGALLDAAHDVSCVPNQTTQQSDTGVRL